MKKLIMIATLACTPTFAFALTGTVGKSGDCIVDNVAYECNEGNVVCPSGSKAGKKCTVGKKVGTYSPGSKKAKAHKSMAQ